MKKKIENTIIEEEYLLNSKPEIVFNYFKDLAPNKNSSILPDISWEWDEKLLNKLLKRNENLINLALAAYTGNINILKILLKKKNENLRLVVLQNEYVDSITFSKDDIFFKNPLFGSHKEFINFLKKASKYEIFALFQNPKIYIKNITKAFAKEEPFDKIDNDIWYVVVSGCSSNVMLRHDPNSSLGFALSNRHIMDISGVGNLVQHEDAINTAWKLFDKLECNKHNAGLLQGIFSDDKGVCSISDDKKSFLEIEKKWKKYLDLIKNVTSKFCNHENLYNYFEGHKNKGIREAYYKGRWRLSGDEITKLSKKEKDLKLLINSLIFNKYWAPFRTKESREVFYEIVKKYDEKNELYGDNAEMFYFQIFIKGMIRQKESFEKIQYEKLNEREKYNYFANTHRDVIEEKMNKEEKNEAPDFKKIKEILSNNQKDSSNKFKNIEDKIEELRKKIEELEKKKKSLFSF